MHSFQSILNAEQSLYSRIWVFFSKWNETLKTIFLQSTGGTKQADAGNDSRASESVKDGM